MKVTIIGGGVGGMAAAIALAMRGVEVNLYERAAKFEEIGAGVQISPNGVKVLRALGVEDAVMALGFEPECVDMVEAESGRAIVSIAMKAHARGRWGAPYIHVRRSDLHNALLNRARELGVSIELGKAVNAEGLDRIDADLIIAADGIHSQIRFEKFGRQASVPSGKIAYRAVVPLSALTQPPKKGAVIWAGKRSHAVTTYIDRGETVNFVGICEGVLDQKEWNGVAQNADVRALFAHYHPSILELIEKAKVIHKWSLYDELQPVDTVTQNLALLGDAAHSMSPSFAQGAVMALEDAWVLAREYCDDPKRGLACYAAKRRPRTCAVQAASRANLARFSRSGAVQWGEQMGAKWIAQIAPSYYIKRLDWLYGEDVTDG